MNAERLRELLQRVSAGELSVDDALNELKFLPVEDLGFARLDIHRELRKGLAEVIFCQGKTPEQVAEIAARLAEACGGPVLATRASPEHAAAVRRSCSEVEYREQARCIIVNPSAIKRKANYETSAVGVLCAGTADIPVAEEAAATLEVLGDRVERIYDIGVAGLHRLLEHRQTISSCACLVVVAGMEGALASVVAGLVSQPVIAVPTSVGYGASFGGLAALLGMLNTCAAGVAVVNIDNGFGGGYLASLINRS